MAVRDFVRLLALFAMAITLWPCISATQLAAQETPAGIGIVLGSTSDGENFRVLVAGEAGEQKGFWIGILPRTIDQELAEKLNLRKGQGVLVGDIVGDSPAAKINLQKNDVILAAGRRELGQAEELAEVVAASEGKPLRLKIRRGEKIIDLEITPVPRGEIPNVVFLGGKEREAQPEQAKAAKEKQEAMLRQLRERLEQAQAQAGNPHGGVIYRPQPGQPDAPFIVTPRAVNPTHPGLPEDMEVTIQKRGNKPATVTVKQGQKMWRTTESELGMLPTEALGFVAQALGRPALPGEGGFHAPGAAMGIPAQRFEVRLGEDGKTNVHKGPAGELSAEGIRIELKAQGERGEKPAQPVLKWQQLKRPEPAAAESKERVRELEEQVKKLRHELEERNKRGKPHREKERSE